MKNSIHTLSALFLLLPQFLLAQGAEKTLVSSINPQGQASIVLEVNGEVEIVRWNSDFIKVQATVQLANSNEAVLKSLVTAGRYRMTADQTGTGLRLSTPGLHRQVKLGGLPIEEHIRYYISIPQDMKIEYTEEMAEATVLFTEN